MAKKVVRAKRPCCQSRPRCKRCPVVLRRLEKAGLAKRKGKGFKLHRDLSKRDLRDARTK